MEVSAVDPGRDAEIDEVMRTTNLLRPEAEAAVASRYGEDISDFVGIDGPLTPGQKRRLGLGCSIVEFMEPEPGTGDHTSQIGGRS